MTKIIEMEELKSNVDFLKKCYLVSYLMLVESDFVLV